MLVDHRDSVGLHVGDGARHQILDGADLRRIDAAANLQDDGGGRIAVLAGEHLALAAVPFPGVRERAPLVLRQNAFSQLCARMGAPAPYLLGLPAKLQLACANYGMSRLADRSGLVRLAGNEARAIVSDRYAKLDDEVVLEALYESLGRLGLLGSIRVRAVATGGMTALRMSFPNEAREILPSDPIEYGLDISNGELGARSVGITSSTYRLVCTNGMRAWRSDANMRLRHVGSPNKLREAFLDGIPVALAAGGAVPADASSLAAGNVDLDDLNDLQKAFFALGSLAQKRNDPELLEAYNACAMALSTLVGRIMGDVTRDDGADDADDEGKDDPSPDEAAMPAGDA